MASKIKEGLLERVVSQDSEEGSIHQREDVECPTEEEAGAKMTWERRAHLGVVHGPGRLEERA